ncbi:hypothetical protein EU245_11595 [Lentibacillus lipolyticus]|nr:hypothetical protein EU245_11595 [Lentibacillus lipolyticus]
MSDHKKVIHVKDLVIKADNVHIEPRRPRRDPFFGPYSPRATEERDAWDESSDHEHTHHDHSHHEESTDEHEDRDDRGGRPPFSWI